MSDLIDLDGSFGEGGGQILRSSLALSVLTGRPFHLRNIRARRTKPGLQPQHLQSVLAAAEVSGGKVKGAQPGSSILDFEPGTVRPGTYTFDIGTAGSTGLVLHTVYLPLALAGPEPSELHLVGGTHNDHAPSFDFLHRTWRSYLELIGLGLSLRLERPGFYPRGGGGVTVHIQPASGLRGLRLGEHGEVTVSGVSAVAGLDRQIARRQARRAQARLEEGGLEVEIVEQTWQGGPGTVLTLTLDTQPVPTTFFALGAKGKRAEAVADEAVDQVFAYLGSGTALVDAHSADQLILPLSLAAGPSEYAVAEVTQHLLTNVAVVGRFLDREIVVEGAEGEPGSVRIADGPGYNGRSPTSQTEGPGNDQSG